VPGPRRQARELALQVLYAGDSARRLEPELIALDFGAIAAEFQLPRRARERALEIARGVVENRKQIDERIEGAATRWKLHRIAAVDRNVLRVATWELLFDPATPAEVILDEAVEIARRFAGEASPGFVNGVLDVIARCRAEPVEPVEPVETVERGPPPPEDEV
jgi:N utilization substance protein B